MGLFGAMIASVSGLGAQGQAISVISDNLANTNTIGYKSGRALFNQLVTSASGTSYNAGGVGTNIGRDQSAQGSFITSSSRTDLAISGNGFFRVGDTKINTTNTSFFFTRAGNFSEDKEGYLVNPDGFYLQGWKTNSDGTIQNIQDVRPVELQSVGISSQATNNVTLQANLNSTETLSPDYNTGGTLAASLASILATPTKFDFVTDMRVFDGQGGARDMTVGFTKRAANFWDYQLYTDGSNIQGGATGTRTLVASGTLRFTPTGALKNATGTTFNVNWAGGVNTSTLNLNFGDFTGGKIVTSTTGLNYTNGVLDVATEDNALVAQTYTVRATADGTYTLGTGTGGGFVATSPGDTGIVIGATGNREIYFPTSKVRITVDNNFVENPGGYPVDTLTFTVANQTPLANGIGTDGVTQLAAAFNTNSVNQDGFGAGSLAGIQVDNEGFVNGTFTNGETKKLYKIAVAVFQNPRGLETISGSLLRTTEESGLALLKQAGVGGTGRIVGGSLEGSTTDIANEFSNMIVAQRAFQASSKVITTVDQMLNELLQLR
ncbi:MAG: flagellar hook protein FlgE [Proteobacteria bacterium]|nr:flagellar hook protein FlgE [Pseudomonadota bacterium]